MRSRAKRRIEIESCKRLVSHTLSRAGRPDAIVRDQKPMSDAKLKNCLEPGISPQQWYEILNDKVFFWVSREKLNKLLHARAYRTGPRLC
jgi:hypothetical protein